MFGRDANYTHLVMISWLCKRTVNTETRLHTRGIHSVTKESGIKFSYEFSLTLTKLDTSM